MQKTLVLLCLILSQFGFAQSANREALFFEAFDGLPFFTYAAAGRMDKDFYINDSISGFSAKENAMLKGLLKVLLNYHQPKKYADYNTRLKLEFVTSPGKQWLFDLEDGQVERTAVTQNDVDYPIYINVKRINDPTAQIDFIDAIQLLIHEVGKKIPGLDQVAFDSMAAKIVENLRSTYSTFKIHENRKIHILTIDRPPEIVINDRAGLRTFWQNQQGYEITTFDETNSYHRHIEEMRHQFANPQLVRAHNLYSSNRHTVLTRNNIAGVEVDRFSDSTTVIRVVADQIQTLIDDPAASADVGQNQMLREFAITLKGDNPPHISKRQGYLTQERIVGRLRNFEIRNSTIVGMGLLPVYLSDMKDMQLFLIVRSSDATLNIPLKIVSTDPKGPVIFSFERKIAESDKSMTLVATDILVSDGLMKPLNRVSLDKTHSVEIKPSKELLNRFVLKSAMAKTNSGWSSIRKNDAKVDMGDLPIKFVVNSDTLLQEMTLYLEHTRQIYDPNKLKNRTQGQMSNVNVRPSPMDSPISTEAEVDVFRFDASQMKQRMNRGSVEVEITLPLRESMVLQNKDGPYHISTGFGGGHMQIEHTIDFGVDLEGDKRFAKIVLINQNMQKISIDGPKLRIKINGKKGNHITPEFWQQYRSHFDLGQDQDQNDCKDMF